MLIQESNSTNSTSSRCWRIWQQNNQSIYTLFLNNQNKQYSNFTKEQQKCCNYIKMLDGNGLDQEILLTTRQKIRARNAFNNNMSTVLKLSKAKISKILQSGQFL